MNILHIVSMFCFTLCLVIFFYLKWYVKKRTSSSGVEEHKTELYKLIADINMVTDRNLQLIEDNVAKLKVLLHDVDNRIAVYEKDLEELSQRETAARPGNETLYTNLKHGIRNALLTPLPVQSPVPPPEPVPVQIMEPPPENLTVREWSGKPPSKRQIRAHIDILLNEGLSPEEIASRLEISVAEVNLAMNLRRNQ